MRTLPLLLLLAACQPGGIKISDEAGDDTGPVAGDSDGDGYAALDAGGEDCDDADAFIFPGAEETWYDGIDQDCDGGSDYDQDADGADASPTGADCDDLDATVGPGTPEVRDLADNDCDGTVDEDFITSGAIVVSEVMHRPLAASDADGEWFEITNADSESIDLVGWTISSDDGDGITIEGSLILDPGDRVVLGANANTGLNGGIAVDYVYDRAQLSLSADDTLFVGVAGGTVFDIEWTSSWTMTDGRTISLDPDHQDFADARQSAYWCVAKTALPSGDYGTPGGVNDQCTSLDEDGDGYSEDRGDCDDGDADVSPGNPDTWDGIDNDCSGFADDGDAGDAAVGFVNGAANTYLGVHTGLGLGDVTGDGTPDIIVGSALQNSYKGTVYLIDGNDYATMSDAASDYAIATFSGGTYTYSGATSPLAGDLTGDGVADLVVASGGFAGGGSSSHDFISVFAGGPGLLGDIGSDDATFNVTGTATSGAGYGNNRVLAHLDMNGDGLAELVYGMPNSTEGTGLSKGQVAFFDAAALGGSVSLEDADTLLTGDSTQDYLGVGLGGGDVDGDGYDDVFVGATGQDDYATNGGVWYQISGRATPYGELEVDNAESRTISGATASAQVGFGAPAIGDFDEDGFVDFAFGGFASNRVWVIYGIDATASNLDSNDADLVIEGEDGFGMSVTAGDFDDDGAADLAVGAPAHSSTSLTYYWYMTPGNDDGALYVFDGPRLGTGTKSSTDARASALGETSGDLFGSVASGAADLDGDGADEILVAAPRQNNGSGRVYAFRGQ